MLEKLRSVITKTVHGLNLQQLIGSIAKMLVKLDLLQIEIRSTISERYLDELKDAKETREKL